MSGVVFGRPSSIANRKDKLRVGAGAAEEFGDLDLTRFEWPRAF